MTLPAIAIAFLVFATVIWSVHAINEVARGRYGYAPFSLPNLLVMLIPNGLLLVGLRLPVEGRDPLSAIFEGRLDAALPLLFAGLCLVGMFLLIRRRTNSWMALYAAALMTLAAVVLLPSVLFRNFAVTDERRG